MFKLMDRKYSQFYAQMCALAWSLYIAIVSVWSTVQSLYIDMMGP